MVIRSNITPDWKVRNLPAGYFRQLFFTLILYAKGLSKGLSNCQTVAAGKSFISDTTRTRI